MKRKQFLEFVLYAPEPWENVSGPRLSSRAVYTPNQMVKPPRFEDGRFVEPPVFAPTPGVVCVDSGFAAAHWKRFWTLTVFARSIKSAYGYAGRGIWAKSADAPGIRRAVGPNGEIRLGKYY